MVKAGGGPVCPTLRCFLFWEGVGVGDYFQGTSARFLISPHHHHECGECVCAQRVNMGGGGAGRFNNAAFTCCKSAYSFNDGGDVVSARVTIDQ